LANISQVKLIPKRASNNYAGIITANHLLNGAALVQVYSLYLKADLLKTLRVEYRLHSGCFYRKLQARSQLLLGWGVIALSSLSDNFTNLT